MNDTPYLGETTDLILGQEFLTWLWCKCSIGGIFNDTTGYPFTVSMEKQIVVQGGEGETLETASVTGVSSELREARMGLSTGKKVTRALIEIEKGPETWQVTLKSSDFSLGSLKTPKVEIEADDDPDAVLLEKIALIETCLELVDKLFADFLELRLDSDVWIKEVETIRQWVKG